MKYLSYMLIIVFTVAIGWFALDIITSRPVSQKEFRQAHKYLNKRVDTLSRNQKVMIHNQKLLYKNQQTIIDTVDLMRRQLLDSITQLQTQLEQMQEVIWDLYKGQQAIYFSVTKQQNINSFEAENRWRKILNWLKGEQQ